MSRITEPGESGSIFADSDIAIVHTARMLMMCSREADGAEWIVSDTNANEIIGGDEFADRPSEQDPNGSQQDRFDGPD